MTSALGFKARVDPFLASFVACVHGIVQIHFWCNTYGPFGGMAAKLFVYLAHKYKYCTQILVAIELGSSVSPHNV